MLHRELDADVDQPNLRLSERWLELRVKGIGRFRCRRDDRIKYLDDVKRAVVGVDVGVKARATFSNAAHSRRTVTSVTPSLITQNTDT